MFSGIVIFPFNAHDWNALFPIDVNEEGKLTSSNEEHDSNAFSNITCKVPWLISAWYGVYAV